MLLSKILSTRFKEVAGETIFLSIDSYSAGIQHCHVTSMRCNDAQRPSLTLPHQLLGAQSQFNRRQSVQWWCNYWLCMDSVVLYLVRISPPLDSIVHKLHLVQTLISFFCNLYSALSSYHSVIIFQSCFLPPMFPTELLYVFLCIFHPSFTRVIHARQSRLLQYDMPVNVLMKLLIMYFSPVSSNLSDG
jgi:hypothetical protein